MTHGADTSFLVAVEIIEHERHTDALRALSELLDKGNRVAIAPQVLAEFVHVVTDPRRFQQPLSIELAVDKSQRWWNAAEVNQVFPNEPAVVHFHDWMRQHKLGRKRVLTRCLPRLIAPPVSPH